MIPILLDFNHKKVVVFGGGEVGLRKASYFASEAEVTAVSNAFVPGFRSIRAKLITGDARELVSEWVRWADFVVAATDDRSVNDLIEEEAKAAGKLCNRADAPSDFMIPSVVERRNFVVAISTLGRSPAMSRFLRMKLAKILGAEYESMVELQEELRQMTRRTIPDQKGRERFLWRVLEDQEIWNALGKDYDSALDIAKSRMSEYGHNP